MSRLRVMLVDDHTVVRAGLRAIIAAESDLEVVAEAADGEGAIREAEAARPDVVVMDIRLGGAIDGIDACREIKSAHPGCAVLMLTSFTGGDAILGAFLAGAAGFLVKNTGAGEFLDALRRVGAGESLLDPGVVDSLAARLSRMASPDSPDRRAESLSAREREVLALVAQGRTNREIAEELVIAPATARNHVSHILEKLGMSRRSEAAAFAVEIGLAGSDRFHSSDGSPGE